MKVIKTPTAEERKQLREDMDKLNAEAAENWHNQEWRTEQANLITDATWWGFQHENLLEVLTMVERVGMSDQSFVEEKRGLRAHFVARGGAIMQSTITSEKMELPRETVGFAVEEFEDKLMNKFAETTGDLITQGIERLDAEVNLRFLRLLQAAIPDISSPSYITGAGLSLTALNTAIRQVKDSSKSKVLSLVGRATMTDLIIEELTTSGVPTAFLPATNEEFTRRGVLGTYRGVNIVELINYQDDTDTSFFPANEMFLVGQDASKFAFYGSPMAKEWTDNDWYWHYKSRMDIGGVVTRPERLRRIVDTSQPA